MRISALPLQLGVLVILKTQFRIPSGVAKAPHVTTKKRFMMNCDWGTDLFVTKAKQGYCANLSSLIPRLFWFGS
jgi:hypothetical protein